MTKDMEKRIARAFKVMKGGMDNIGYKPLWWTKEYESEVERSRENFAPWEVSDADWIIMHVVPVFEKFERELIVVRYGGGYVRGYRKCGSIMGIKHWKFIQQFHPVMKRLKILLDKKPLLAK